MKGVPLQEMVSATQNLRLAKPKLAMPIFKSTHPRIATMDLVHTNTFNTHTQRNIILKRSYIQLQISTKIRINH